ncbi:unnamed protein product [Malus baccata var. baccata]
MDQQCGSSMVAVPYIATRESDDGGKLVSISAMAAYKEKSHKELRWEASEKLLSISAMPGYEEKSHEQIPSTNTTSTFNLPPLISNPSSFDPASTSTTFKFNPTAPSAAPTVPDDGTSSQMVPQMSIGCGETIQYGISSMPVIDKPATATVRVSHLLSSRHLTKRRVVRLPARNYNPKNDGPRIAFFIN